MVHHQPNIRWTLHSWFLLGVLGVHTARVAWLHHLDLPQREAGSAVISGLEEPQINQDLRLCVLVAIYHVSPQLSER
jgi:hypothetical protein